MVNVSLSRRNTSPPSMSARNAVILSARYPSRAPRAHSLRVPREYIAELPFRRSPRCRRGPCDPCGAKALSEA
jgi:hypothetical protein